MSVRDEVHELVDALPDEQLPVARSYLELIAQLIGDPLFQFLHEAPEDDEPTTPEEDRKNDAAWREYQRDGGMRSSEAKRSLLS